MFTKICEPGSGKNVVLGRSAGGFVGCDRSEEELAQMHYRRDEKLGNYRMKTIRMITAGETQDSDKKMEALALRL